MAERFSEDEARRIFARAAERQGAAAPDADGLTLDELRAIGEASGIDPEHVAAAVAEIRAPAPEPASPLLGVPPRVHRARVVPGALTGAAWAEIVGDLRDTFRQTGTATDLGDAREWTTSTYGRDGLRFTARPADGGTRLAIELDQRDGHKAYRTVGLAFGALTAVLTLLPFVLAVPDGWPFGLAVGACLALSLAIPWWMTRGQVRHAERAFGPLLDRAELAARRGARPASLSDVASAGDAAPSGDAAPLGDALSSLDLDEPPSAPRRRRRTR